MSELRSEYRLTRALGTFQELTWLDDVWTRYLDAAREIPEEDVDVLHEVAVEIQTRLDAASGEAEWLRSYFAERAPELDEGLARAVADHPLTDEARSRLLEYLEQEGGFAATALAGLAVVVEEAPLAHSEIATQREAIDAGELKAEPPKRGRLKCAILGVAAGIAIGAGQWGIAVSILLHMNTIGCFGPNT